MKIAASGRQVELTQSGEMSSLHRSISSRRRRSGKMWTAGSFIYWATGALVLSANLAQCLRQQQEQQQSNELSSSAIGSGGQAASYESGADYSSSGSIGGGGGGGNAAAIAALTADGLMNLGQPANSKRARKMSAFMPMRGRKDGRDSELLPELSELLLASPMRETDGDASIMRLVSLASGPEAGPPPSRWVGNPRGFANQLFARRLMQLDNAPSASARFGFGQLENVVGTTNGGQLLSATGDLMQAKPRRAFHPMRGKKSLALGTDLDELDSLPE